jgi:putative aldouronate transport system substrate-binding protein
MKRLLVVLLLLAFLLIPTLAFATGMTEEVEDEEIVITFLNTHPNSMRAFGEDAGFFQAMHGVYLEPRNMRLEMISVPDSDYQTRKNLLFAAGDYPDLFREHPMEARLQLNEGIIYGLSDLIDAHAPNLQDWFDDPKLRYAFSNEDGEIVGFPAFNEPGWTEALMIRGDWLDELGLDLPRNLNELYEALRAFKENDMAGDGNTIPFTTRYDFFYAFWNDFRRTDVSVWDPYAKTYRNAVEVPEFEEALRYLNQLHEEGLLDEEYVTQDSGLWEQKVSSGWVGVVSDNLSRINWVNSITDPDDPEGPWIIVPPFPDSHGIRYHRMNWDASRMAAMSTANEHPVETVEFMDWFYPPGRGHEVKNFGLEGVHYERQDGIRVFNKDEDGNLLIFKDAEYYVLGGNFWPGRLTGEWGQAINPLDRVPRQFMLAWGREEFIKPKLSRSDELQEQFSAIFPDVKDYMSQNVHAFIRGARPFSEYGEFVEEMRDLGMDDLLEIELAAYEDYKVWFDRNAPGYLDPVE